MPLLRPVGSQRPGRRGDRRLAVRTRGLASVNRQRTRRGLHGLDPRLQLRDLRPYGLQLLPRRRLVARVCRGLGLMRAMRRRRRLGGCASRQGGGGGRGGGERRRFALRGCHCCGPRSKLLGTVRVGACVAEVASPRPLEVGAHAGLEEVRLRLQLCAVVGKSASVAPLALFAQMELAQAGLLQRVSAGWWCQRASSLAPTMGLSA
mmetsp:Transcript_9245/g.26564  ORF Transcript_9245/g.26564 Transcript_9245/m.26564 type:complete len:206 (-) Transcript_9245:333-950(-)